MDAQAIQSMKINQKEICDWLGFTKTDLNGLCDCDYEVESEGKTGFETRVWKQSKKELGGETRRILD